LQTGRHLCPFVRCPAQLVDYMSDRHRHLNSGQGCLHRAEREREVGLFMPWLLVDLPQQDQRLRYGAADHGVCLQRRLSTIYYR
jgi:hypothetical protein